VAYLLALCVAFVALQPALAPGDRRSRELILMSPSSEKLRHAGELTLRYDNRTVALARPSVCRDC